MKTFLIIYLALICTNQAHGQSTSTDHSFFVEAVVRDVGCHTEDPWQPAYNRLFSKLQNKADDICRAFNIKARLDKNEFFYCENSFLKGAQSFSCLPPTARDCSYGKCCPGGICD